MNVRELIKELVDEHDMANWRVAFDFVPIVHGKAQWNDAATFERCGKIAEGAGRRSRSWRTASIQVV